MFSRKSVAVSCVGLAILTGLLCILRKTKDPPPATGGTCSKDADCTNVCIANGILPCCRDDKACGCTWAPGAYCL